METRNTGGYDEQPAARQDGPHTYYAMPTVPLHPLGTDMEQNTIDQPLTRPDAPGVSQPHRTFGLGSVAGAVVVALGAGFGAGWASHTSGTSTSTSTTSVHGTLTLSDGAYDSVGTSCSGSGGYQDISGGVAVNIGDQSGKTLSVTSLEAGHFGGGGCQFDFSTNVTSSSLYTVTISHRGTQTFTPDAIAAGFNLTLGG